LHERLSDTAQAGKGARTGDQDAVTTEPQGAEQRDQRQGRQRGARVQFPKLEEPHLVLASAAGIHSTAGTTTHIASIEHTALSSGGHTSISAGKSLLASVKDAVRLFAYKAIRLTAATAGIDIVALQDSINLMAKLDIKLAASFVFPSEGQNGMIVSPPFLSLRDIPVYDDQCVKSVMPGGIVGSGAYPVSQAMAWHGGLHIHAPTSDEPVRAIADGIVVFRRDGLPAGPAAATRATTTKTTPPAAS
jgi:hypothetical protein